MKLPAWAKRRADSGARESMCSPRPRRAGLVLALACAAISFIAMAVADRSVRADGVASAVYVRSDSDDTLVVSPRVHATAHAGEPTQFDVAYVADVWTSASIDVRASASRPVTEQRNELNAGIAHDLGDLTLGVSYRYSTENDYESHGGSAGGSLELADNSTTLSVNGFGFWDDVGRAGDPDFSRDLSLVGARASWTQVFDPKMLGQLTYELNSSQGYHASPYRFVGIGPTATGFGCVGAHQCFRERVPESRLRHAIVALLRRALSNEISLGAEYRYYFDDWEQRSHTVSAQLGWMVGDHSLLTLRYRFYTQLGVWFYARTYAGPADLNAFVTRDREQSPMGNHRVSLDFEDRILLSAQDASLVMNLQVSGSRYNYDAFVGLTDVYALEVTLALGWEN